MGEEWSKVGVLQALTLSVMQSPLKQPQVKLKEGSKHTQSQQFGNICVC